MRQNNCCHTLVYQAAFCAICVLICLRVPAQTPTAVPSADNRSQHALYNPWQRTLAPLKIGTTRTVAEKMLALAHARLLFSDRWGSGQSDTYRMDRHWTVTVCYNYTGVKYDKTGTWSETRFPQNKVMSLPDFVQDDEKRPGFERRVMRRQFEAAEDRGQ